MEIKLAFALVLSQEDQLAHGALGCEVNDEVYRFDHWSRKCLVHFFFVDSATLGPAIFSSALHGLATEVAQGVHQRHQRHHGDED